MKWTTTGKLFLASTWLSSQSKANFTVYSGDSPSKHQHHIFWEPSSFQTLSNTLKSMVSLSCIQLIDYLAYNILLLVGRYLFKQKRVFHSQCAGNCPDCWALLKLHKFFTDTPLYVWLIEILTVSPQKLSYHPQRNNRSQVSLTYSKVTLAPRWNLKSLAAKSNLWHWQ